MTGFNRWVKTWMADYVSVQEVYWNVPGEEIDVTRLPFGEVEGHLQRDRGGQTFHGHVDRRGIAGRSGAGA